MGEASRSHGAHVSVDAFRRSVLAVEQWVEKRKYKGYEPFDGLSSALRPLTFGSLFAERLLQQVVRQSPINLRPILGVAPAESTKGRGYMAWGYLKMLRVTGDTIYAEKARECLAWLMENKSPESAHYSWGNHFDFSSRMGRRRKLAPIIPWTGLIGQAFMDAYDEFGDVRYLDVAVSSCEWIQGLPRTRTATGVCIAYDPYGESTVHGASMLGAALLARTAKITGDARAMQLAAQAMEYSCTRQNADGSWYYAEEPNSRWIDNFHTGYNLDSLKCYIDYSGDRRYDDNLRRGLMYFMDTFFEENGRPKYYDSRAYPIDIQCASQAIDTLSYFAEYDSRALVLARRVASWTIINMQDRDGHFYYRQLPLMTVRTPMLHWGQATMHKALAHLLCKVQS